MESNNNTTDHDNKEFNKMFNVMKKTVESYLKSGRKLKDVELFNFMKRI